MPAIGRPSIKAALLEGLSPETAQTQEIRGIENQTQEVFGRGPRSESLKGITQGFTAGCPLPHFQPGLNDGPITASAF